MSFVCLLLLVGCVLLGRRVQQLRRTSARLEDQLACERDDHQNFVDRLPRDHPETLARLQELERQLRETQRQLHDAQVVLAAYAPIPDEEHLALEHAVSDVHARITRWQLRARAMCDDTFLGRRRRAVHGYQPGVNDPPPPSSTGQPTRVDTEGEAP